MSILDEIIAKNRRVEYMSVNDIIARYPNGITINGVAKRDGIDKKDIPCFTFAEEPNKFFYATTTLLADLFSDLIETAGGLEAANALLAKEHLKVRMYRGRTKTSGNNFLYVECLGKVKPDDNHGGD